MRELFDGKPHDLVITYLNHTAKGMEARQAEVKGADFLEGDHGITLRSVSEGALLGVFVPWHMVIGISLCKPFQEVEKEGYL